MFVRFRDCGKATNRRRSRDGRDPDDGRESAQKSSSGRQDCRPVSGALPANGRKNTLLTPVRMRSLIR